MKILVFSVFSVFSFFSAESSLTETFPPLMQHKVSTPEGNFLPFKGSDASSTPFIINCP